MTCSPGRPASDHCLAALPVIAADVDRALAAGERVFFTADTHEIDDAEFEIFPRFTLEHMENILGVTIEREEQPA